MVFGVKLPSSLPTWMSKHYGVERDKVSQLLEGGVCKLCLSKKGKKEPCASLRWIDGRRVLFVPDIVRVMDDGSCKNVFQAYLVTHFAGKVEDVASYVLLKFKKKEHTLNKQLSKTYAKKEELLRVLERPETPLHNNRTETDAREMVVKRKVSGGTRSEEGQKCRDTFISLKRTCIKLEISFMEYLKDRINGLFKIPNLFEIIRRQSASRPSRAY